MSQDAMPSLQFDRADFAGVAPAVICGACNRNVIQNYYTLGERIYCATCREQHGNPEGGAFGRFFRATGAAMLVALAGALLWWGIRAVTNYELALIAIAIGHGVGRTMQWGTRGRTNRLYQLLAVLITYTGIVLNYVPDIAQGMADGNAIGAAHVIVAVIMSFAAPFLMGATNIIGILIIGFGLYRAWTQTRPRAMEFAGPYSVTPGATAAPANA
jgi:hypothetical protein